jgi:hypothetical protein
MIAGEVCFAKQRLSRPASTTRAARRGTVTGLSLTRTGRLCLFCGTMLGWLGVALPTPLTAA